MKRSNYLPVGFLALALAGSGAMIATAQTAPAAGDQASADAQVIRADYRGDRDRGARHMRGKHHGKHRRGGFGGEMMRTLFDAVDADGDGTVTREEVDSYRASRLAEVDASGDGALSIEEFDTLYREFTRSRMVDMFQHLDADGDGVISRDEMDTRVSRMFDRMDRDGDGALTLQQRGASRSAPGAPETDPDN
ncbi:hypothetical protein D6850_03870 [Roseovarius spongiae]|uniref:EF-hand domain-containing protein n=1 Tax=Roseovarius spongiae TaxID=2320272 RepID=A0A3A8AXS7_9RHOB|nr:EF-hand domain-containing protein [Roseovarius spongiae]RKF16687.1 hypothetical protein D6850_03870 [Roseovarius spongiae]